MSSASAAAFVTVSSYLILPDIHWTVKIPLELFSCSTLSALAKFQLTFKHA